jgi:hypothetical protein
VEQLLHEALASVHLNILRPVRVSLRKEAKNSAHIPMTSSMLTHFPYVLCPQLLS